MNAGLTVAVGINLNPVWDIYFRFVARASDSWQAVDQKDNAQHNHDQTGYNRGRGAVAVSAISRIIYNCCDLHLLS